MSRVHPVFHVFLCLNVPRMVVAMLHHHLLCCLTALRIVKLTRFCSIDLGLTSASPTIKSTLCLGRVWGLRNVHGSLSTSLKMLLMWCRNTGTDCSLWLDLHHGLVKLPLRIHTMWTLLRHLHMQLLQHLLSSRRSVGDLLNNTAAHLHASSTQRLLEVNQSDDQHVCQISTSISFCAFICACF